MSAGERHGLSPQTHVAQTTWKYAAKLRLLPDDFVNYNYVFVIKFVNNFDKFFQIFYYVACALRHVAQSYLSPIVDQEVERK